MKLWEYTGNDLGNFGNPGNEGEFPTPFPFPDDSQTNSQWE